MPKYLPNVGDPICRSTMTSKISPTVQRTSRVCGAVRVLIVEAAQHALAGARVVVLDERQVTPARPQLLLVVRLHEEAAVVLEGIRPKDEHAVEIESWKRSHPWPAPSPPRQRRRAWLRVPRPPHARTCRSVISG